MLPTTIRSQPAGGAPLSSSRRYALVAAGLAVAVYASALGHAFVFDDRLAVIENPSIRHLDNLHWIVIGSRRPLTNFSYALDWAIWNARPFGFHLTNLVLHAANVLLLFVLARRLFEDDFRAFSAAAVFAVHPILSETVGYVASRPGLLCTFFLLLGLWTFHRGMQQRSWWAITFACWLGAAASKETGLLLPLLCGCCDLLFGPTPRRRRILMVYLPAGVIVIALGAIRLASYLRLEGGVHRGWGMQLLTQAKVFWRYVFLVIAPVGQSVLHEVRPARGIFDPLVILSLAGLLIALLLIWRSKPTAQLGAFWFLALLLPSSLVPLSQPMAEHRIYEAFVGVALLAATFARRKLPTISVIVVLAILTVSRERVWAGPVSLWRDAALKSPRQWMAHYALADALRESGACSEAIPEYEKAITLRPEDRRARRNLAICEATLGQFDKAAVELEYQLAQVPRDPTLHYDLALVEAQRGHREAARRHLLRAIELRPGYPLACDELQREFPAEDLPISCSVIEQLH